MPTISRHYVYAGERRVHYRRAGDGPPLVLLHSCPGSSVSMESLVAPLAARHTVIALDNPGFGESQGVGRSLPSIGDYALALAETLDQLGIEQVDLIGHRTGAKIALDLALQRPGRVRRLALEGFAHYTPEETVEMFAHYTPDMTPQSDGGHNLRTWMMWRNVQMWWPWFDQRPETRIVRPLTPPEVLHGQVVDFLRAGKDYWQGYHAAFRYPGPTALCRLTIPTLLFATSTDPLRLHMPRLGELPPIITSDVVPAGTNPRLAAAERLLAFFEGSDLPAAPPPPAVRPIAGAVRRDYVVTSIGELLIRRAGDGVGRPVLLVHDLPGSGAALEETLIGLGRPALAIDLPGAGDSAALPGDPTPDAVAGVLAEALDTLGIDRPDVVGIGLGGVIAKALARRGGAHRLVLEGLPEPDAERAEKEFPPLQPRSDGAHLVEAWGWWRDRQLWAPWYDRTPAHAVGRAVPTAEALHAGFLELIKGGRTYQAVARAALAAPDGGAGDIPALAMETGSEGRAARLRAILDAPTS
ncbi:MAG: alpha/beta fold hydrolase [Dehalococcoidia bacterium]